MQISAKDIDRIEEAGMLDDKPVKLIRLKGGFWLAIGKRKGKQNDETLTAGSHPAILKYNLERQFTDFQPAMMKSENGIEPVVARHSHFLDEELRKSGHDIFSIQTGAEVEFQLTKQNMKLSSVNGLLDKDHLIIDKLDIPKELTNAFASATVEKAVSCNVGLKLKQ